MRFTELFAMLVIRHKVMTMTEFYNADAFDLDIIAANMSECEREPLERMRQIMWAVLAPNSKKKLSPDDIMKFSWEMKKKENTATTKEQFDEMVKKFNLKTL